MPEEPKTPLIQVAGLSVRYARNGASADVLRDVNFSVAEGDTLTILGPNGSGKSTLLHAIAGACEGTVRGQIQVRGRSLLGVPRHRRAWAIAMVQQDTSRGTAAHLTLREHCELTSAAGGRKRVTWEQVAARLQTLGTALDPRQPAGELSGGQRQLFTVLLAVLSEPGIMLLDEPTSSLDTRHAALVLSVIREFSGPQKAAIFVTHDLSEARQVGNRLLVLDARGAVHAVLGEAEKGALDEAGLQKLLTEAATSAWTQRFRQELPIGAGPR